jgi:predicted enzyme related to lactoylglutathione lyase
VNIILIGSEDPQRLAAYYTKIFGTPDIASDGFNGWQLGGGWITVGPHDDRKQRTARLGRLIWNIETPDVKGDFERLRAAGALVVQEPYRPGAGSDVWIATLSDPDGNYFQLLSPL